MQLLVKLSLNCLYGENIRKDIDEKFACKSEACMMSEYDERVRDYWKISGINWIVKMIDEPGLEDEFKKINTMPLHLGAFVLSNSKSIMNQFIHALNGFFTNDVYYTDTDSLYIGKKHWDKLDKAGFVGKNLLHGKNDYKERGIFYGLFLAPKIKFCWTKNKCGVIDEHKAFKVQPLNIFIEIIPLPFLVMSTMFLTQGRLFFIIQVSKPDPIWHVIEGCVQQF